MNRFHVAVLRILVKRLVPIKLSSLVDGFPDSAEDNVLAAISDLKLRGLIVIPEYNLHSLVSIPRSRRREALEIVSSNDIEKIEALLVASNQSKKSVSTRYSFASRYSSNLLSSRSVRIFAISSVLVLGLMGAVGPSLPSFGPETAFVSHHTAPAVQATSGGPEVSIMRMTSGNGDQYPSGTLVLIEHCHNQSHNPLRE